MLRLYPTPYLFMAFDLGELAISLNLNQGSFQRDLDRVEQRMMRFGSRRLSVMLEVDDSGLTALKEFENNIVKTQRWLNRNRLTVRAGHEELTELNKHIEAKRSHLLEVQQWLDANPLTVRQKQEKGGFGTNNVKQEIEHSVSISAKDNADKINKYLGKELKQIGSLLKNQKKNPVEKILGIGGSIGSSLLTGLFTNVTKGIGTNFEAGLNESLADIIGSLNFFGKELGKAAGETSKQVLQKSEAAIKTVVQGGTPEQIIREKMQQMQSRSSTKIDFDDPQIAEELARQTVDEINRNLKGYLDVLRKILPSSKTIERERFITKGKAAVANRQNEQFVKPGMNRDFLDAKKSQTKNDTIFSKSKQKIEQLDRVGLKLIEKRNAAIKEEASARLSIAGSQKKIKQAEADKINGVAPDPFYDEKTEFDNIRTQQARIKELEQKQQSLAKKIVKLSDAKAKITVRGTKAGQAIADGKSKADRLSRQFSDKNYERDVIESTLKELGVTDYDPGNLPKIRSGEGTGLNPRAAGAYVAETNEILLEKQRYQAFKDRKLDTGAGILGKMTIAHEVSHFIQLGSGLAGVSKTDDIRLGVDPSFERVTPKTGQVTKAEFTESFGQIKKSVEAMVAGYQEYQREFEADAEMAARRVGKRAIVSITASQGDTKALTSKLEQLKKQWLVKLVKDIKQNLTAAAEAKGIDPAKIDFSQLKDVFANIEAGVNDSIAQLERVGTISDEASFKDIAKFKSVNTGKYQQQFNSVINSLIEGIIVDVENQIETLKQDLLKQTERPRASLLNKSLPQKVKGAGKLAMPTTQKIKVTQTNAGTIAAGENLANSLFRLSGQVKSFSETLAIQKQKAATLRKQLPSTKEIKVLPPTEKIQKATSIARIAAQGIADQKSLINSIPEEQRTQGGQVGQARSLLGEFTKQFNKAKRILANEKIDIDDVVNMKNITSQVEIVGSDIADGIGLGAKKNKAPQKAMETVAVEIMRSFDEKIERRSPPKKFILRGFEIVKALAIGIYKNRGLIGYAIQDLGKEVLFQADSSVKGIVHSIKSNIKSAVQKAKEVGGEIEFRLSPKLDLKAYEAEISQIESERDMAGGGAIVLNEFTGVAEYDKLIDRARKNANRFDSAEKRILSGDAESKIIDRLNRIKKAFRTLWNSDEFGGLKSNFGRRAKLIFNIVKDIGVKAALKFGALAVGGILAFKGISAAIHGTMRATQDLFFNTQKNVEAFQKLYSLQLRFKSAGLSRTDGFAIAQRQGISLDALSGQAPVTSSLRRSLGTKRASEIAEQLSEGLTSQGLIGEDLTGSLRAFGQIGSKGKVQGEEILQIAERGIDIKGLSQSALGVTANQMEEMQRSGKLLAVEYLPAIADEMARAGKLGELPTAELQRALNNAEKLRASLGEGTLNATRPILQAFNAIAKQGTAISGLIKGLGTGFAALGGYGVVSLVKIAMGFTMVNATLQKALATTQKFSLTTLPMLAGIAAGLALIGTTIAAIQKKSEVTISLEEMAASADKLADSLEHAGKVEIKAPERDRFGANLDGNFAQWLFSGDMGARLVDTLSFGGLTRMKEADETIATGDLIQNSGKIFTQSLRSPEALQQIVADIQGQKARLAAKKVELIDLTNAKAGRDEIRLVNREIGDISGAISGNKKLINSFVTEYENLKAFMETDQFGNLSESNQTNIKTLFDRYAGQIDFFRGLQEQIEQKTKFELEFNLAQSSIEAAKMDLEQSLAELEIRTIERGQTEKTDVALQGKKQRRELLKTQLNTNRDAIFNQREELFSKIPDDLKASISSVVGGNSENATSKQLLDALTKLENSSESAGDDLKKALELAKALKQNELDALNKRKEILALEMQIAATEQKQKFAGGQISATIPLAGIRLKATNQETALASTQTAKRMSSAALSMARAKIQLDKAAGELAVINNRLNAVNTNLSNFDTKTQQWFLNIIGQPTANFADAINSVSSELLQEVKTGFGEEIGVNPQRANLIEQLEKFDQLRSSKAQTRLTQAQNQASISESLSDQLFQSLQSLESELQNSGSAIASQRRSLQDLKRGIEDYTISLKDTINNLRKQITEVQRNIALTQIGGSSAFFSAAGIQNQITDFFSKMSSLVEQGSQITASDRRPELRRELKRDRRDNQRRNEQFDRQKEDIRASTNSQIFQSNQAIDRLNRENFRVDYTEFTDEEGNTTKSVSSDAVRKLESRLIDIINTANFQATSVNDFAASNNSPQRVTGLVFDRPNLSQFMDDPEAIIEAIEVVRDRTISIYRERNRILTSIQAEGLKKASRLQEEANETFKEQEKEKTRAIEAEGELQAAKTEKFAKTIQGTYLALNRSLELGAPSIKLETDKLSLGNKELVSSILPTRDNQPLLTARKKAEIAISERQVQLQQQNKSLNDFTKNANIFASPNDLIGQIDKMPDFKLKDEIISKLANVETQGQIAKIIAEYRNQLDTLSKQLKDLNSNKDKLIDRAGKLALNKYNLEKSDRSLGIREQLGGVLKESGKLNVFESAKQDRLLGTERINLDFEQQKLGIEHLKTALGGITPEYKAALKALEALRDAKLDNLIEQTNVWSETLKDSAESGFSTFVDTMVSDFGDLDKLWRNTLASMLQVFANFVKQLATQELLKGITSLIGGGSGSAGSAIASAIVGNAAEGGMVERNTTIAIPNLAQGGLLGAISDAYQRERAAGFEPVLIVANTKERVLNAAETKKWNAWEAAGITKSQIVPNHALGGQPLRGRSSSDDWQSWGLRVGQRVNSAARSYSNTNNSVSSNDYSSNDTININLPDPRTNRLGRSNTQQAALIAEKVRRAKNRNG